MDAKLPLCALENALVNHPPCPGWIQHSDRRSQYLSQEYIDAVTLGGGSISGSDKACPQDNAFMESFFKTLKAEAVWLEDYENFKQANQAISKFIEYYSSDRMRSSLNYLSPEQFELSLKKIKS